MKTESLELLTIKDVAALMKVTPMSVDRWVRQGVLPQPIKLGGRRRWSPADIARAIEEAPRATLERRTA
jgi:excisionase family DNA binding protein